MRNHHPFFYKSTQTMATSPPVDFSVIGSVLKSPNNMFMVSKFHAKTLKTNKYMILFYQCMKNISNIIISPGMHVMHRYCIS